MVTQIIVAFLCFSSFSQGIELFTSTGKYDYGLGGVLIPGVEITLIEQSGPGVIDLFQFASEFEGYEETTFNIYYDGEARPYTSAKFFKGMLNSQEPTFGTNGKASFYITVKIPFEKSIKITATIETSEKEPQLAYWSIRGLLGSQATVGGFSLPSSARLKIYETEEMILYPFETFTLASSEVNGGGLLYASQLDFKSSCYDFLEGRITFTSNNEEYFLGTGIDDYLASAWWFTASRGTYEQSGVAALLKLKDPGSVAGHRIHERDLIPWSKSFEFNIRNGDKSLDGSALGVPDITQISARVWTYEWNTD